MSVETHVHNGSVALIGPVATMAATFGTLHLLALSLPDNRWARAWLGLGF
jgi:hypothetical protein